MIIKKIDQTCKLEDIRPRLFNVAVGLMLYSFASLLENQHGNIMTTQSLSHIMHVYEIDNILK